MDTDDWNAHKRAKADRKSWHQENTRPRELEMLKSLPGVVVLKIESDGDAAEKYVLDIQTDRGNRVVEWWTATSKWRIRGGRAQGVGIYRMARYFNLVPRTEPADVGVPF